MAGVILLHSDPCSVFRRLCSNVWFEGENLGLLCLRAGMWALEKLLFGHCEDEAKMSHHTPEICSQQIAHASTHVCYSFLAFFIQLLFFLALCLHA